MSNKNESPNYGKIVAITVAVVAGACAVIWFAIKLYRKYCLLECDYGDELNELDEDALFAEDGECEVVIDDEPTGEGDTAPAQA
ncbi:MAG: hypothetical protein IIX15_00220 [Clostridia bacterium]|nr:hypothetical protein [Clostridia bacterium]